MSVWCSTDGGDGSTQSAPAVIDRATGTTTTGTIQDRLH